MKALPIVTAGASAGLFIALGILSKGWLEPAGLPIFDARVTGYNLSDATDYLEKLTPQGRALYLGLFRVLDSLLPVALFLTLLCVLWRTTTGLWPLLRGALLVLPMLYLFADLMENAQVARLLSADGGLDAREVRMASSYTQLKWLSLGLCLVMVSGSWLMAKGKRDRTT